MPYTKENLNLAFKPNVFFYELEKISRINDKTLESAYYRAVKSGLVEIDDTGIPRLTTKGRLRIKPYKPKRLSKQSHLLVIFDIPEDMRAARDRLRLILKELSFAKVQQSVWASPYDHTEYLTAEISEYNLSEYVFVYEAVRLKV